MTTGFKAFDPSVIPYYGYGKYPNVYTSLEVERLLNAGGPTAGKLVLRDGSTPKRVGIVHCVGSRDANYHPYCSRVCCMYALKLAHLVREKTEAEVYNCYIDIRTPGKGFEEFYNRVQNEGVQFIRGKVADITPVAGKGRRPRAAWSMQVDDTLLGTIRKIDVDMVILAVALGAAGRRQRRAPHVRHLLLGRRLLPGETPQAGAGQHGQRRRVGGRGLPGREGHPRHGRPGRRRGRQGPGR